VARTVILCPIIFVFKFSLFTPWNWKIWMIFRRSTTSILFCFNKNRHSTDKTKYCRVGWGWPYVFECIRFYFLTLEKTPYLLFRYRDFFSQDYKQEQPHNVTGMILIFWACHPETSLLLVKCEPMRMENSVAGCCRT
jgi:hypothetical protein